MKKFYITSPLYYVNASPHIGHAYTQIACDTVKRFLELCGHEACFMTGTDEHGEKIEEAALKAGYKKGDEKKFVDSIIPYFRKLWDALNIDFDFFIRTTDSVHEQSVQKVLQMMYEREDIYEGVYKGWFCTPCESFWTDFQVKDDICPDCKRSLERIEEKNYFFRLSKYQEWLISYINENSGFIKPDYRRNEILSFLKNPLQDLCISRPKDRMAWGIEIPFNKNFVTYVWFDALINYISGIGFLDDKEKFQSLWPADIHIIGKDILRHHAIYWPIILRSVDLAPPKTIFAHGWWTVKGEKMSKSRGNIVDPRVFIDAYGTDAFRYFLLREVTFGLDGTFGEDAFISRFNSDLANDLGNLVNRTLTMVDKYFSGSIPQVTEVNDPVLKELNSKIKNNVLSLFKKIEIKMAVLDFSSALSEIWDIINQANKYIEESKPWERAKKGSQEDIRSIMRTLLEALRIIAISIYPFMPASSNKIYKQLGYQVNVNLVEQEDVQGWDRLKAGTSVYKDKPLFPRIVQE